jgi:hypothetical protein
LEEGPGYGWVLFAKRSAVWAEPYPVHAHDLMTREQEWLDATRSKKNEDKPWIYGAENVDPQKLKIRALESAKTTQISPLKAGTAVHAL